MREVYGVQPQLEIGLQALRCEEENGLRPLSTQARLVRYFSTYLKVRTLSIHLTASKSRTLMASIAELYPPLRAEEAE
jgi:hypothetical protein